MSSLGVFYALPPPPLAQLTVGEFRAAVSEHLRWVFRLPWEITSLIVSMYLRTLQQPLDCTRQQFQAIHPHLWSWRNYLRISKERAVSVRYAQPKPSSLVTMSVCLFLVCLFVCLSCFNSQDSYCCSSCTDPEILPNFTVKYVSSPCQRDMRNLFRIARLICVVLDKRILTGGDLGTHTLVASLDYSEVALARRTLHE